MSYGDASKVSTKFAVANMSSGGAPLHVELTYRTNDPFAVTAVFEPVSGYQISWLLSRELLIEGMHVPVGDGDIRIAPAHGDSEQINILLSSPDGQAWLMAYGADITEFLDATFALVARGDEARCYDWDGELKRMTTVN
jgi:Streptomyces sporulation and cell division protein, SsgA